MEHNAEIIGDRMVTKKDLEHAIEVLDARMEARIRTGNLYVVGAIIAALGVLFAALKLFPSVAPAVTATVGGG